MDEFGEIDDFDVQGRPIKIFFNGDFENGKVLFVQSHWSWDEFLCTASQRLEMVPTAKRVFNADGAEIDDVMCIEEDDMLFFSTDSDFEAPTSKSAEYVDNSSDKLYSGIIGGYKVGAFLGRGGFGEVRLGIHQLTQEEVALKFILKSEMGSLGDVERTTKEIQCLTTLSHPNVIKLLRVLNEEDHIVLVFELLKGGDLFHYLKDISNGIPEEEGNLLFSQLISGVGYAHNQHICHRDLKLENILLANTNDILDVKIADFGLSDFYRPGATMKTNCGSISYLAPEVFRGTCNAGPPLDVWSLGVILFAILCGRLPFEGSDLRGTNRPRENVIRNRILRCQYKMDESLSLEAQDLIQRMLKLDPNERATIPEIFGHPWVRGRTSALPMIGVPSVEASRVNSATDHAVVCVLSGKEEALDNIQPINERGSSFMNDNPQSLLDVSNDVDICIGYSDKPPLIPDEDLPSASQRSPNRQQHQNRPAPVLPSASATTTIPVSIRNNRHLRAVPTMKRQTSLRGEKAQSSPRGGSPTKSISLGVGSVRTNVSRHEKLTVHRDPLHATDDFSRGSQSNSPSSSNSAHSNSRIRRRNHKQ